MTTARVPLPVELVAVAVGAPVVDVEPTPVPGSFASVFHAFRAEATRPGRLPLRISVLPYADPAWARAARAWLAWEAHVWVAFWEAVRARGPDAGGRWPLPPLVDDPRLHVRVIEVPSDAGPLVALARPWLPWPTVADADLPEERIRAAWARGVGDLAAHLDAATPAPAWPAGPGAWPDARRRLLTDGRQIVPTHWRGFDPRWQGIDAHRRRVPTGA